MCLGLAQALQPNKSLFEVDDPRGVRSSGLFVHEVLHLKLSILGFWILALQTFSLQLIMLRSLSNLRSLTFFYSTAFAESLVYCPKVGLGSHTRPKQASRCLWFFGRNR